MARLELVSQTRAAALGLSLLLNGTAEALGGHSDFRDHRKKCKLKNLKLCLSFFECQGWQGNPIFKT